MYDNDAMTQRETELIEQIHQLNLVAAIKLADVRALSQQLAELQARTTAIIEALESLCHAVERGDTDFDYMRQLAQDGRWAITPPKEEV